jgi:hypothetical protein
MEWAPAINTLTLFDITGQPAVEGRDPPECQICYQGLYDTTLFPSEITTCHHRFHRDCLRNQWCNNNAGNTLEACRCPTCQQIFSCETQLQDLTPQVNARLQELQQPAVLEAPQAEAQGVQVEQAEVQVQQIPANNLQIYTQQNYLIDRATRRFTDCLPQIERLINDRIEKRVEWVERQIKFINSIAIKFKFIALYAEQIRRILPIINRINDNLQNQDFITRLLAHRVLPNGYTDKQSWINSYIFYEDSPLVHNQNRPVWPNNAYDGYVIFFSALLLQGCYTGETRGRYEIPEAERANSNPLNDPIINNLFKKLFHSYLLWETEANIVSYPQGNTTVKVYEIVPSSNVIPDLGARPIDIRFFQRYFQCFVDFLTALLEVNYNQAFQLQGGKRIRKTKKIRKIVKKVRKTKRKGKK